MLEYCIFYQIAKEPNPSNGVKKSCTLKSSPINDQNLLLVKEFFPVKLGEK